MISAVALCYWPIMRWNAGFLVFQKHGQRNFWNAITWPRSIGNGFLTGRPLTTRKIPPRKLADSPQHLIPGLTLTMRNIARLTWLAALFIATSQAQSTTTICSSYVITTTITSTVYTTTTVTPTDSATSSALPTRVLNPTEEILINLKDGFYVRWPNPFSQKRQLPSTNYLGFNASGYGISVLNVTSAAKLTYDPKLGLLTGNQAVGLQQSVTGSIANMRTYNLLQPYNITPVGPGYPTFQIAGYDGLCTTDGLGYAALSVVPFNLLYPGNCQKIFPTIYDAILFIFSSSSQNTLTMLSTSASSRQSSIRSGSQLPTTTRSLLQSTQISMNRQSFATSGLNTNSASVVPGTRASSATSVIAQPTGTGSLILSTLAPGLPSSQSTVKTARSVMTSTLSPSVSITVSLSPTRTTTTTTSTSATIATSTLIPRDTVSGLDSTLHESSS